MKEEGLIKKLFVTGCLSERYKEDLISDIPEVDGFYGTGDLPELLKNFEAKYRNELLGDRIITTDSHYAYLKISKVAIDLAHFVLYQYERQTHFKANRSDYYPFHLVNNGLRNYAYSSKFYILWYRYRQEKSNE